MLELLTEGETMLSFPRVCHPACQSQGQCSADDTVADWPIDVRRIKATWVALTL